MAKPGPKPRNAASKRAKPSNSGLWANHELPGDTPGEVREAFRRLVKALREVGTYHRTDPAVVATAARTLVLIAEADREIDEKGLVVRSGNGTPMPNPAVGIRNALVMRLRGAFNDMGLTAASSRLGDARAAAADADADGGDSWGGLLGVTG